MVRRGEVESGELFHALTEALEGRRRQIQEGVLSWTTNNPPRYPWRQSGRTLYEVLIGEAWLEEKPPAIVVPTYQRFVQRFLSIKAVAEAGEEDLSDILSGFGVGPYAQRIKMLVKSLLIEGKGDLPRDSESFARASGLEHHHIRAILCFGYGLPTAIIDANVSRMLSRLFSNNLPSRPEEGLLQAIGENLLPYGNFKCYNSGLLELAELVCRDAEPQCTLCPVAEVCDYAEDLS